MFGLFLAALTYAFALFSVAPVPAFNLPSCLQHCEQDHKIIDHIDADQCFQEWESLEIPHKKEENCFPAGYPAQSLTLQTVS